MILYGRKVFLGGLPIGITSEEILANFDRFGPACIDWPNKCFYENVPPAGYAFIIFDNPQSVNRLMDICSYIDYKHVVGVRTLDGNKRLVEVKPWDMTNNEIVVMQDWHAYERLSVFVGGLPRTIPASELGLLVQEAVGGVAYVGIEIDAHTQYPKGAARIVFNNQESYVRSIAMREITVFSGGVKRVAEIKPFIHPKMNCEMCNMQASVGFCHQIRCLKYFCDSCWKIKHSAPGMTSHKLMQKGRFYMPKTKDFKDLRCELSCSQSSWPHSSNSSCDVFPHVEPTFPTLPSVSFNTFGVDPRTSYLSSCDSAFGANPFDWEFNLLSASSTADSVFDFTQFGQQLSSLLDKPYE